MNDSKKRRYLLLLTEAQVESISCALEFYERAGGMGQLGEVLDPWRRRCRPANIEPARRALDEAQNLLTGLPFGASFGICSPEVPDEFRVAYDLHQVLRHRLAWDRYPQGGTNVVFDKPRQTGQEPLATIKRKGT